MKRDWSIVLSKLDIQLVLERTKTQARVVFLPGKQPIPVVGDLLWVNPRQDGWREDMLTGLQLRFEIPSHSTLVQVTRVRVQRLQSISFNDIIEEGLSEWLTDEQQTDSAHIRGAWLEFGRRWDETHSSPQAVILMGAIDYYVSYPWEYNDRGYVLPTFNGKAWVIVGNPTVLALGFRLVTP